MSPSSPDAGRDGKDTSPGSRPRLDAVLIERALAPSRERAQSLIAAGLVEVDGRRATRSDQPVAPGASIRMLGRTLRFASRAGGKLAGALDSFGVDPSGRVALDAGASTGGFTDVLLQRGARRVYAVDVGYGLLDQRIANDPRVTVMDRTNLRTLAALDGEAPSLVTLDLSFISLRAVLGRVAALAEPGGDVVALFKPQFELSRAEVGRGGVVLNVTVAEEAARTLIKWAAGAFATEGAGPLPAAVRGAGGNQEFLIHLRLPADGSPPPGASR